MNLRKEIEAGVAQANFVLRSDVLCLLKKAYSAEKNSKAKKALGWILDNAAIAKEEKIAICQDTGLPVIFIDVGKDVEISSSIVKDIEDAVACGYMNNYLRPSIVDPLRRGKSSYHGAISHVHFLANIKGMKITIFPKGFGSENKSRLKMFNPTAKVEEIEDFIINSVKEAGPASCPPFVIGVGVGGTSDCALLLAKRALLGKIDKPNKDKFSNDLEMRLLKKINALGIGPMGFGGRCTALAVKVKTASTHIAGLPVGVNISCHALRSASIDIKNV
ncbi:MAG: fumarate hydratase [Candidatus Omnitrophica bacterium]|nr:fumarate hydratase [Candidatus Omnitrophota bacterium]